MLRKFVIGLLIIVAIGLPHTLSDALGPGAAAVVLAVFVVVTVLLLPYALVQRAQGRIWEANERLARLRAGERV